MKRAIVILMLLTAAGGMADITPVVRWDVETGRMEPRPYALSVRRGESVNIEPRFLSYSAPIVLTNTTIQMRYATNYNFATYYAVTGSVMSAETGRVHVAWNDSLCPTNSTMVYEIRCVQGTNILARGYGSFSFLGGIGGSYTGLSARESINWPTIDQSGGLAILSNQVDGLTIYWNGGVLSSSGGDGISSSTVTSIIDALAYPLVGNPSNFCTLAASAALTNGYVKSSITNGCLFAGDTNGLVGQGRTLTINGVSYDLSADRSWTISAGGVSLGDVTNVTTALSAPLSRKYSVNGVVQGDLSTNFNITVVAVGGDYQNWSGSVNANSNLLYGLGTLSFASSESNYIGMQNGDMQLSSAAGRVSISNINARFASSLTSNNVGSAAYQNAGYFVSTNHTGDVTIVGSVFAGLVQGSTFRASSGWMSFDDAVDSPTILFQRAAGPWDYIRCETPSNGGITLGRWSTGYSNMQANVTINGSLTVGSVTGNVIGTATGNATSTQGSHADTAYGWGNHAAAGYLSGANLNSTGMVYVSGAGISAANGAYAWGILDGIPAYWQNSGTNGWYITFGDQWFIMNWSAHGDYYTNGSVNVTDQYQVSYGPSAPAPSVHFTSIATSNDIQGTLILIQGLTANTGRWNSVTNALTNAWNEPLFYPTNLVPLQVGATCTLTRAWGNHFSCVPTGTVFFTADSTMTDTNAESCFTLNLFYNAQTFGFAANGPLTNTATLVSNTWNNLIFTKGYGVTNCIGR